MVDYVQPAETWGDKAWKDEKGGGRRQRHHRPVSDGKVIDSASAWEIPMFIFYFIFFVYKIEAHERANINHTKSQTDT